ncbi:UDP-N-acetylmuramoyl-tripeptide--D-alanyl-D-alanine ligase [Loktanella sp. SALINAS62]|uniref:UDP-N-acetylmuramoyl-tripeptide--D-alanyl-D- alanine ligase n=1 Tax=Loktanella sp. SALINAS62 TaxID=2706124 RepID=UPI001B8BDECE|nr:UDP-N-acetylmuramoyl-tripeptide--D-alanyl-D-alanine ligase [Loktanella sp. SALINAS62]MBS1303824.1 UDP-N-acetylmuramoyl-tripeptide--D-alanyl-D-alanine ligase [Loktanella sp. SALINAS62]
MTPLWTSADAVTATKGETTTDWQATGVSIDTRTVQPGDLFVALTAARDGHDFVAQALEKGAAAALVSHRPADVAADAPLLIVDDVLAGLADLARFARARTRARIVAVTGSVGKTSTKEMLRSALAMQGRTHAAEASYNNHWGVPLTLARMPVDTQYAIIEIGMNHPGEIAPLSRLTRPHVVMVTTVAPAHLEAFENLSGIAREKASIVTGLDGDGVAVLNADLDTSYILTDIARDAGAQIVTFGTSGEWALGKVRITDSVTTIAIQHDGTEYLCKLSVPGRHFAMNAVAVLAAADALGADPVQSAVNLSRWQPPQGRGTRERVVLDPLEDGITLDLIDDAFNANPTSMDAALEVLAASLPRDDVGRTRRGRRIAILGDMLELGPDEMAMHAGLADSAHLGTVNVIHCAGPRMRALFDALPAELRGHWAPDADDLAATVRSLVDAGDVVLVKGSKGSHVSRVVDAIRKLGHR